MGSDMSIFRRRKLFGDSLPLAWYTCSQFDNRERDNMSDKSLTHIYYGNGKGKTTAALGLALRASGQGKKVVIVQFLKEWKCGELAQLALLPNITVFRGKSSGGKFVYDMSGEEKLKTKAMHDENLMKALALQRNGMCDLLILDEAIDAYQLEVLDAGLLEGLMEDKPETLELVVTGHKPDDRLLESADYITEMVKHRHPYDAGVAARRGVEF